ncbi:P2 phage tail completion protein R (GpR) [compost metagenome]
MSEKRTSQLDQLTDFVQQNLPDWACKNRSVMFKAFIDNPTILTINRDLGLGLQIGATKYEAVLSWERFPYRKLDPQIVFALARVWLEEHADPLRDQLELRNDPDIDVVELDEENAIFAIAVEVVEVLSLVEDPKGMIPYRGRRWSIDAVPVWTAEQAVLYVNDEPGIPISGDDTP